MADGLPNTLQVLPVIPSKVGPLSLDGLERRATQEALVRANGNKVSAAKSLGINRRALYRLIEKHDLEKN